MRRAGLRTDPARVADRLDRFVGETLRDAVTARTAPLEIAAWPVPGEPVPFAEAVQQEFAPFAIGSAWGHPWSTLWLRVRGTVPTDWPNNDRHRAEIAVDLGFDGLMPGFQAEGLAFRPDGSIVKAISPRNSHLPISGREIDLYLELAGNPGIPPESHWRVTSLGDRATAGTTPQYRLRRLEIVLVDGAVWDLARDLEVVRGLARQLPDTGARPARLWAALDRMMDAVDPDDVAGTAESARTALAPVLAAPATSSAHTVLATGHAHIDTAWLWPVRETVRKCARTFSNAVALMDEHPDFRFVCSQAQQLAWVKDAYPDLFARIREKVATGQFIPVGSQWVEPDTNMPSGESTVRQLAYGKRFFLDEFGVETREVWLPDTFGYSAALPQIMKLAGVDWFMTQKISWNQVNAMPHHTFWWEGIDGTRIFTHFPPIETYNAELSPAELAHAERTYRDHDAGSISLAPFGWGDGGGGPTREMVAAALRQADLEGSPRVRLGTPTEFYEIASNDTDELPVWRGEMYLELHRGTLTSQLRTKQGNRRSEELLHAAELWSTTAAVLAGAPYPHDAVERLWKRVLMLQFHDILPGSSIAWVHREAESDHVAIQSELAGIVDTALAALASREAPSTECTADAASAPRRPTVANSASMPIEGVPPFGIGIPAVATDPARLIEREDGWVLSNGAVEAVVDRRGVLVSLRGADGREAVAPGGGAGMLRLHRDRPDKWDAWDIDPHHDHDPVALDSCAEIRSKVDDGVAVVRCERTFGGSTLTQTFSLAPGHAAVDVTLDLDWHEQARLIKFVCDWDVHADDTVSETQFGHVSRPTHRNTSWDEARFEVAGLRWLLVQEPGYGVAIANDSTHGFSARRIPRGDGGTTTRVALSVIRGPRFPDPDADQGLHRVRFALRPAADLASAAEEARRLAHPLRPVVASSVSPIVRSTDPDVLIDTVKLADDRSGDVVVRLYEASGGRRSSIIVVDFEAVTVQVVDLLERAVPNQERVGDDPAAVAVRLRPFEILTLRYRRRA